LPMAVMIALLPGCNASKHDVKNPVAPSYEGMYSGDQLAEVSRYVLSLAKTQSAVAAAVRMGFDLQTESAFGGQFEGTKGILFTCKGSSDTEFVVIRYIEDSSSIIVDLTQVTLLQDSSTVATVYNVGDRGNLVPSVAAGVSWWDCFKSCMIRNCGWTTFMGCMITGPSWWMCLSVICGPVAWWCAFVSCRV
jgi:hypothetical protein